MIEGAVALQQAEAAHVVVDEDRDGGRRRIAQRPPNVLAGAGVDEQAVGIVQLVAEVVVDAMVVLAAQEHRRQRRHVERGDGLAGEQRRADVDARLHRRHDFELERAGDRLAVEQGVNDDAGGGFNGFAVHARS